MSQGWGDTWGHQSDANNGWGQQSVEPSGNPEWTHLEPTTTNSGWDAASTEVGHQRSGRRGQTTGGWGAAPEAHADLREPNNDWPEQEWDVKPAYSETVGKAVPPHTGWGSHDANTNRTGASAGGWGADAAPLNDQNGDDTSGWHTTPQDFGADDPERGGWQAGDPLQGGDSWGGNGEAGWGTSGGGGDVPAEFQIEYDVEADWADVSAPKEFNPRRDGYIRTFGEGGETYYFRVPAVYELLPKAIVGRFEDGELDQVGFANIPLQFKNTTRYLQSMREHIQMEFEEHLNSQAVNLSGSEDGGWRTWRIKYYSKNCMKIVVDGVDWENEPWGKSAVHFEGQEELHFCRGGEERDVPSDSPPQCLLTVAGPVLIPHTTEGRVRCLGYIGSFLKEYESTLKLQLEPPGTNPLLEAVAKPGPQTSSLGGSLRPPGSKLNTKRVPANESQVKAVKGLTGGLDIIHGPPGTGKSTTIYHVIAARVAQGGQVLVTCTRNQAIDAIVGKLSSFGIMVFGNPKRLGKQANQSTFFNKLCNDDELLWWAATISQWANQALAFKEAFSWWGARLDAMPGLQRIVEQKRLSRRTAKQRWHVVAHRWARALRWAFKKVAYRNVSKEARAWKAFVMKGHKKAQELYQQQYDALKERTLEDTRVFLSTIDSCARMLVDYAEISGRQMKLDTAIVDEAACVPETAIPVLLCLGVKNLILVGDHKQLPPFSKLSDEDPRNFSTNHTRSLMERAVHAEVEVHLLDIQYRMHPTICNLVSGLFYEAHLKTDPATAKRRQATRACKWVNVNASGEVRYHKQGYSNPAEAAEVVVQAREATRIYKDVRIITYYNRQKHAIEELLQQTKDLQHLNVYSVDSCQGTEADVIILSTVRSQTGAMISTFMRDPRRINVALSRAKELSIIVGDRDTMCAKGGVVWWAVSQHYSSEDPAGLLPSYERNYAPKRAESQRKVDGREPPPSLQPDEDHTTEADGTSEVGGQGAALSAPHSAFEEPEEGCVQS